MTIEAGATVADTAWMAKARDGAYIGGTLRLPPRHH
jgi:hypothetical protein